MPGGYTDTRMLSPGMLNSIMLVLWHTLFLSILIAALGLVTEKVNIAVFFGCVSSARLMWSFEFAPLAVLSLCFLSRIFLGSTVCV